MTKQVGVPKVTVRREIEASAEALFDAWLDPESLAVWMRPGGIERTSARVDPREGGGFEIVMHAAAGPIRHTGVYRVIDRPKRLVFTWVSPATRHTTSLVSVDFRPGPTATTVVVTHEQLPDEDAVPSHTEGWSQVLGLLASTLGAGGRS